MLFFTKIRLYLNEAKSHPSSKINVRHTQRPRSMSLPVIHQSERRSETLNTNQNAKNLHAYLLDVAKHYKCLHCQKPLNRIKLICINKGKHTQKRVEEMLPRKAILFYLRIYDGCNMSIHFKVKGISV